MARTSNTLLFVVAGLVGASTAMSQGSPRGDRVADREQIAAIIQKWEQAWNSHDMHAFASLFQEMGLGFCGRARSGVEEQRSRKVTPLSTRPSSGIACSANVWKN